MFVWLLRVPVCSHHWFWGAGKNKLHKAEESHGVVTIWSFSAAFVKPRDATIVVNIIHNSTLQMSLSHPLISPWKLKLNQMWCHNLRHITTTTDLISRWMRLQMTEGDESGVYRIKWAVTKLQLCFSQGTGHLCRFLTTCCLFNVLTNRWLWNVSTTCALCFADERVDITIKFLQILTSCTTTVSYVLSQRSSTDVMLKCFCIRGVKVKGI